MNKQEKEDPLLQRFDKILTVELFLDHQPEKTENAVDQYNDQEGVEQIADAERNPTKEKALDSSDRGIQTVGIVSFNEAMIKRDPFYGDTKQDQQYPAPAFHQALKQPGNKLLHNK